MVSMAIEWKALYCFKKIIKRRDELIDNIVSSTSSYLTELSGAKDDR